MELQLMKLRKKAGYKNRDQFAEKIGVNKYTYRSWETGAAMMNLEQACMVADVLECTLDELAGREPPAGWTDEFQAELNRFYEECTPDRRAGILQVARDGALASGEAAKRAVDAPEGFVSAEVDLYRRALAGERSTDAERRSAVEADVRRAAAMGTRERVGYEAWKAREIAGLASGGVGEASA